MDPYLAVILAVSAVGIAGTVYLSYHTLKHTPADCWWFPKEWCLRVQYLPQSRTFGVPNSFAGLVMYAAIFVLTLLYAKNWFPFWPAAALIGFGFAFSVYFLYVQARVLRAFCTWCVVSRD